jgi:GDPmannose 4,6-dehydratase
MVVVKRALISGITGQDGSYLSELLLKLGYEVHGIVRPSSTFNRSRIEHLINNDDFKSRFYLHYGDLSDSISINSLLSIIRPDEFYNLAAQSHVGISFNMPQYSSNVNGSAVINILESIKSLKLPTKFYQACTSEMFGNTPPPQSINSIFNPQSPYAAAKLLAFHVCQNYKNSYGMHISCGILFNHESYRRGHNFVTKKITNDLVKIKNQKLNQVSLGNIHSYRDWGWAPEYVLAMWQMVQMDSPINLVVGTGKSASVMDFLQHCCNLLNLDLKQIISINNRYFRPLEVDSLCASTDGMKEVLGWIPSVDWKKLGEIMVGDELRGYEESVDWDALISKLS